MPVVQGSDNRVRQPLQLVEIHHHANRIHLRRRDGHGNFPIMPMQRLHRAVVQLQLMRRGKLARGGDGEAHRLPFTFCPFDLNLVRAMPRYFPDLETFREIARSHDLIPVYRQLLGDRLTPVSAFEVLGRDANAFLLESVVGGERIARYSFIATSPSLVYQAAQGRAMIWQMGRAGHEVQTGDPLADLAKLLPVARYHHDPNLPAFTGGLVGYAGYDTIRYYESEKLTAPPKDDRHLPDLLFGLYNELVIFDHVDKTIKVVANARISADNADNAYRDATRRVDQLVQRLSQPPTSKLGEIDARQPLSPDFRFSSNMTREQYEQAVLKGKEYIKAGDIFQFVPSQRLRVTSSADPFDVYRALRVINPSPFMFYLKTPACVLIGASPARDEKRLGMRLARGD